MTDGNRPQEIGSPSGIELIIEGLMLALIGSGAMMLMVLGLSHLYVGRYTLAGGLLGGSLLAGGVFFATYGSYLDRLERRVGRGRGPAQLDDGRPAEPGHPGSDHAKPSAALRGETPPRREPATRRAQSEPVSTGVVVGVATSAYGVLMIIGGLICTRGTDLLYNLLAGGAFLVVAAIVWCLSRRPAHP